MIKQLIDKIKSKKEFSNIDNNFIENLILEYLKDKPNLTYKLKVHEKLEKSKDFKLVIKEVRKILHNIYGIFNLNSNRQKLLKNLEIEIKNTDKLNPKILNLHEELIKTHLSTKERLSYYNIIYNKIFSIKPKSILDLSSGLNPLSYPWMNLNKVDYIATELTNKDVEFLNKYFKIMKKFNLNGNAIILNLLNIKTLPKVDICFIFKTLDSLETIKKDITKEILNKINAKLIVVSFPKKTISGKKLDKKRLAWFNKLIEDYETFEVENEIFYLINKTKLY